MNKVVIAVDTFKGSLSTFQSAKAIEEANKQVYKGVQVHISPVADGGEGTVEAIISSHQAKCSKSAYITQLEKS